MKPLHFANGGEPAMLLIHGSEDTTVLPSNTESFAARVNQRGGLATANYYEGVGHVAPVLALSRTPWRNKAIRNDIMEFLQRDLSPAGAADQFAQYDDAGSPACD